MSDDINSAFEAGMKRGVGASILEAPHAHEIGKRLVREATDSNEYIAAAEQLGFAYQLSQERNFHGEGFDILGVLGTIYARYPSIDEDVASIAASKLMRRAARGFVGLGEMSSAAINFTNAAVALMEKSHISSGEFILIKRLLDFGFQYKRPGTVDWGYSEGAISMYYAKLPADSRDERFANLQRSKDANERALEIFTKHGEVVSVASQAAASRVVLDLYRERRDEMVAAALLEHNVELPISVQDLAFELPNMIANNILTNPAVYGFEAVPTWLSEVMDRPPAAEEIEMLEEARDRLFDAVKNDSTSDYTALLECRWQAAEIDVELLTAIEAYRNLLAIITAHTDNFTPEQLIRRGSRVVGMARHVGEKPPLELLTGIAAAFGKIKHQRDRGRVEEFLRNNPAHMRSVRFVACELCEHEEWDRAISVIENSRVVLHESHANESRDCDLPSTELSDLPSWVYVTHSPRGTYVILGPRDGQELASGTFLADIDGAKLSDLQFSFAEESVGLMYAQSGGMSSYLTSATARAFEILEPLSKAICDMVPDGRGICLVIGGLYVTLPVSAALGAHSPSRYPYIVVVPSRTQTVNRRYSLSCDRKLTATAMNVPIASYVPDLPDLNFPEHETSAFKLFMSATGGQAAVVRNACTADFELSYHRNNIVHFSGHSIGAQFEPEYSSMLFSDAPYSVSHILELPPARNLLLMVISSCQSGHQSTTVLADEVLGINTALLYKGCRFTLSTLWPVFDVASYVVTSKFYSEIAREGELDIESLYRCLVDTQLWVRTATTAEISDFFKDNALEVPDMLESLSAVAVPFAHPRVWAAYYLSSRCL